MITPGLFRHFKGTLYHVVLVGRSSETEEPMVVYGRHPTGLLGAEGEPRGHLASLGNPLQWWVRPERMFEEEVTWPDGAVRSRFVRETQPG